MDIDTLTLGEIKQISALARGVGGCTKTGTPPEGRVILVVDRGWIFAGDISLTPDGYFKLTRAVHVFRWESIGFAKMVEEWRSAKVDLRPVADVEVPADSVIFRIPVPKEWGLK